jgi:ribonuclease P protein component
MIPLIAQGKGAIADTQGQSAEFLHPAASHVRSKLSTLRLRADFLRAASAARQAAQGFLLQARARGDGSPDVRVGFTCSKKLGNAVARNRAKRRLREIARAVLPGLARPGWDYVLVGRPKITADRAFDLLLADLTHALGQVHDKKPHGNRSR